MPLGRSRRCPNRTRGPNGGRNWDQEPRYVAEEGGREGTGIKITEPGPSNKKKPDGFQMIRARIGTIDPIFTQTIGSSIIFFSQGLHVRGLLNDGCPETIPKKIPRRLWHRGLCLETTLGVGYEWVKIRHVFQDLRSALN